MEKIGPDKPRFSLRQAADLTDTESTWIHELIRKEYFQPAQPATGRGNANILSFNDLLKLEMLKVLGKLNLLKTVAATLIKDTNLNKAGRYFCMGPSSDPDVQWERKLDPKPLNDNYMLSFNLDRIKRKLSLRLK